MYVGFEACCVAGMFACRGIGVWMAPVRDGFAWPHVGDASDLERDKGIRWMPWHQEAMKDVARCEKPWGAASRR